MTDSSSTHTAHREPEAEIPPQPTEFPGRISEIVDVTHDIKLFRFVFDEMPDGYVPFEFYAGQTVRLLARGKEGKLKSRCYNISNAPQEKRYIEFWIQHVAIGKLTPFLFRMKPGDPVTIAIIQGGPFLRENLSGEIIFVATGTGIAPFLSIISDQIDRNTLRPTRLLFGGRCEADLLAQDMLADWEAHQPDFRSIMTLSHPQNDEWGGERGSVEESLRKLIVHPADAHLYVCGIGKMVDAILEVAREIGFSEDRIFELRFTFD